MNQFEKFMKLAEHSSNMGWKVHEVTWNIHENEFALMQSHLTKGICTKRESMRFSNVMHIMSNIFRNLIILYTSVRFVISTNFKSFSLNSW